MKFRPCIDIHNGKVKQLVGGSLTDQSAAENYSSDYDATYYANMYKNDGLKGGHIILLNSFDSEYSQSNITQAKSALAAYSGGLQLGGGVTAENAEQWLKCGASHVIVTSYIFHDGAIDENRLARLTSAVGKNKLVLDLSCRLRDGEYYVVTDRWQRFSNVKITKASLKELSNSCDEFLIHAVDVEGKSAGIDAGLVSLLGDWDGISITYAGGVSSYDDIDKLFVMGHGRLDFTIGSALDLFGGKLSYDKVKIYNL